MISNKENDIELIIWGGGANIKKREQTFNCNLTEIP